MEEIIKILIIAVAFLVVGYFVGTKSAEYRDKKKKEYALKIQRTDIKGMVSESMAPLLPDFPGKFSEARFIGKPVDFLIFNGMDEENIKEVIFVEVKTGKYPRLNNNERTLKDAINRDKNVRWVEYEPNEKLAKEAGELRSNQITTKTD
jgi:predicted Holliday junction resolvase-like endonuclease